MAGLEWYERMCVGGGGVGGEGGGGGEEIARDVSVVGNWERGEKGLL